MRYMSRSTFLCPYCGLDHDTSVNVCPKTEEKLGLVHKMGGTVLDGKYRVEAVIGTGGMGVVYEGRHKVIERRVAIKFLSPDTIASPEVRQRFINEAKIAASLGHKNIVAVLDLGENADGIPYIVMEYLEGESLGDYIEDQGTLRVDRAINVAIQVLEGLHAVHSEGIVHRDLKPENVFLARQSGGEEIVKLLDFGISRLDQGNESEASRLTEAGKVYGTPYYVSPEQAEGKLDVDSRADIYSVGVLLYEMVTGYLPFRSKSYATLMVDIITRPPPDPRDFLPSLPVDLVAVINKALAKTPSLRYGSAREMTAALTPLTSRPSMPPPRMDSRPPARPVSQPPSSSPDKRDSMTGYRIVVPEYERMDPDGPLARARRRKASQPPAEQKLNIPSVPSDEPDEDTAGEGSETPQRQQELARTKPIPRSDPRRATPRLDPDAMKTRPMDATPANPPRAPERQSSPPPDTEWAEEQEDEVDKGWDI